MGRKGIVVAGLFLCSLALTSFRVWPDFAERRRLRNSVKELEAERQRHEAVLDYSRDFEAKKDLLRRRVAAIVECRQAARPLAALARLLDGGPSSPMASVVLDTAEVDEKGLVIRVACEKPTMMGALTAALNETGSFKEAQVVFWGQKKRVFSFLLDARLKQPPAETAERAEYFRGLEEECTRSLPAPGEVKP